MRIIHSRSSHKTKLCDWMADPKSSHTRKPLADPDRPLIYPRPKEKGFAQRKPHRQAHVGQELCQSSPAHESTSTSATAKEPLPPKPANHSKSSSKQKHRGSFTGGASANKTPSQGALEDDRE